MSGTEFRKLHYWNASYYSFRFISLGRFNRFLPRLVQMASFGAGYTTKGALLLSAYDRCRKACFPLHSHTGFLREELQCFCVHASFFITVCEEHQQSNQYSSWQSHRSSELLDKVISVMSSSPRKLLSATKFCIFFFILTCVNFNFELRRLRHHHNIIMAYLWPHLTESKSDL